MGEGKKGNKRKTVALVLGSGGARGYAHIGVIEVLEERGYDIIAVSGCSMGALVGGIYAAGQLKKFKDWATGLDRFDILKLLDVSFSSPGAIRGEKIFSVVRDLIGDTLIEQLPIPYTAVATDLLKHKEVWFQEGPLHQAIRASVAIPSFMTPELIRNRVLVDGALLNPLPIIPTISVHADLIVAVNLSHYDAQFEQRFYRDVEVKEGKSIEEWFSDMWSKAAVLFDRESSSGTKAISTVTDEDPEAELVIDRVGTGRQSGTEQQTEHAPVSAIDENPAVKASELKELSVEGSALDRSKLDGAEKELSGIKKSEREVRIQRNLAFGKIDAMNMAFETMQSSLTQYKLAGYPPDILINIPKVVCKTFDYHKAPELIRLGREIAGKTLEQYENGLC